MEIIQFILNALIVLIAFYSIGSILIAPLPLSGNPKQRVFYKLVVGVIGTIIFTSNYVTSFKTINVLFIPIIIFLFFKFKKALFKSTNFGAAILLQELKYLGLCVLVLIGVIFIQIYRLDFFNPQITFLSEPDFSYYITISEYLFQTRIENTMPWYELNELSVSGKAVPYHYADLWLLGSLIQALSLAPLEVFVFVFLPICVVIAFSGLHTFFLMVSKRADNLGWFILCFLMVFSLGGIPFIRPAFGFHESALTRPKVFLFLTFIIIGFNLLITNKYQLFVITLSTIPIFHVLYAPTVFTALFIFSFLMFYKTKNKAYVFGMIYPTLIASGILIFYLLCGDFSYYVGGSALFDVTVYVQDFFITTFRNIIARATVFYFILWILIGLLWQIKEKILEEEKRILGFILTLILSTIFFRGLLNFYTESFQIQHIINNPTFTILYIFVFAIFAKNEFGGKRKLIFFLISFQAISSFFITLHKFDQNQESISTAALIQMDEELDGLNPLGVFIPAPDSMDIMTVSTHLCYFACHLKMTGKNRWVNSISVPEDLEGFEYPDRISSIRSSAFYRFIQKQKEENQYVNYENAQIDFIKKYSVDFILVEEGAEFPRELELLTSKIIVDDLTGLRMGFFRYY